MCRRGTGSSAGLEHPPERQHACLQAGPLAGDPHGEVELAWSCYQQLCAIYAGTASLRDRRALAEKVIASFPTCPIPEVGRLGRTLRAWRSQAGLPQMVSTRTS